MASSASRTSSAADVTGPDPTTESTASRVGPTPPINRDAPITRSLAILLAFQCVGELISHFTRIPVPGPVIGMVLFLCVLSAAPALAQEVEYVSRGLLNHLSLLFVPAGVGVMVLADDMKGQLLAISIAIIVSTILSIAVAALVAGALMARLERKQTRLNAQKVGQA
jgi:holin-like protein